MAKKYTTVKTLNKIAQKINKDFEISYNKNEGWYLHKPDGDIFIGSDGRGATNRLYDLMREL